MDYGIHALCLAYNREKQIVSGHHDGTIRFVDPTTRRTHTLQVHPLEVRTIHIVDNQRIGLSLDIEANLGVWFANGESIGMLKHDWQCAYGAHTMNPELWTDSQSVLRVFYNDPSGALIVDTWRMD